MQGRISKEPNGILTDTDGNLPCRCARRRHPGPGWAGIALDDMRWISLRPVFLLPVRELGALFRRLFLTRLLALFGAGR